MSEKKTNIYLQRLNSFSKEVDYKYNCISLFSGGGGLDLGAHFAGFKTLLVSDIIPTYTETIKANLPHVSVYNDDAMDLTAEKIRSLANIKGDIDLIIAGPPCQAFSIMGKRQSLDDPRGKLTIKYFELVSGLRPKVFMFENVPGLMTVNHGEDFTNLLEFIENKTGYQLYRTKLNASDFGIPQERERIFIVGFRPDISCESFSFPTNATGPFHDQLPDKMPSKYALESVEGLPNQVIRVHTDAVRKRFEAVPQGGRDRGSYSDRLKPDMPSGTVMIGSSAGGARPFIHPYEPSKKYINEGFNSNDLIDKPQWSGTAPNGEPFVKQAEDTLIPDLISIVNVDGHCQFIIFDAKYYNIQLEHNKKLRGQPGIESITKQYLYQLVYQPFVDAHQIGTVKNCFLMPTEMSEIIEKGSVSLAMMKRLGLEDIQVRLLPAKTVFTHYLKNTKLDIQDLNLR